MGAVLLDFSAAFDHNLLLKNRRCYGFTVHHLPYHGLSYLFNRTQRVFFNGSLSNANSVECGVLQGS